MFFLLFQLNFNYVVCPISTVSCMVSKLEKVPDQILGVIRWP